MIVGGTYVLIYKDPHQPTNLLGSCATYFDPNRSSSSIVKEICQQSHTYNILPVECIHDKSLLYIYIYRYSIHTYIYSHRPPKTTKMTLKPQTTWKYHGKIFVQGIFARIYLHSSMMEVTIEFWRGCQNAFQQKIRLENLNLFANYGFYCFFFPFHDVQCSVALQVLRLDYSVYSRIIFRMGQFCRDLAVQVGSSLF